MANEWRVKQYFQNRGPDSSLVTFSSIDDAKTKIGLSTAHTETNGSPTTTYALADSNQTLVATFEFASESDQTTWYNAMDGATWYKAPAGTVYVEYIKVEWLNADGTVSSTASFPFNV